VRRVLLLIPLLAALIVSLTACGSAPAPAAITAACSQPVVANLSAYDALVDNANTGGTLDGTRGAHHLTTVQRGQLTFAARQLTAIAGTLPAGALATGLRATATDFRQAIAGPGGYTSNQVATRTDTDTGAASAACP
jgi:hypothetical protein